MIFANRHLLFHAIAYAGNWIEHPEAQIWWARRAIASYEAVSVQMVTDPEKIAHYLGAPLDRPVVDVELWTVHYLPRITSSIAAVEIAVERGLPVHIAVWDRDGHVQDEVIDWLNMLAKESHPLIKKLSRITWPQAVIHARRWRDLTERRNAKIAGTEGTTEILRQGKLTWYRLDTLEAIRREGEAMRNCLASGDYDQVPDRAGHDAYDGLYSFRDTKGRSHLSVFLWRGDTTQAYERANRPVRPELKPHLGALEEHIKSLRSEKTTRQKEKTSG